MKRKALLNSSRKTQRIGRLLDLPNEQFQDQGEEEENISDNQNLSVEGGGLHRDWEQNEDEQPTREHARNEKEEYQNVQDNCQNESQDYDEMSQGRYQNEKATYNQDHLNKLDQIKANSTTLLTLILLILDLVVKAQLAKQHLEKILKIIHEVGDHVISNNLPKTADSFYKLVGVFQFHKTYYCEDCFTVSNVANSICECLPAKRRKKFFLHSNIQDIFYKILNEEEWYEEIINKPKSSTGDITDIVDGTTYINSNVGQNSDITIGCLMNTDGVAENNYSLWPLFLVPLISIHQRYKLSSSFLVGLWFDKKKPNFHIFLNHFINQINQFQKNIYMHTFNGMKRVSAFINTFILDIMAKLELVGLGGVNSPNNCNHCICESVLVDGHYYYPNKTFLARTDEMTEEDIQERRNGFCSDSPLLEIKEFSIIKNVTIDFMHNWLEGICKATLSEWKSRFNLNEVDKILDNQKTPSCFKRTIKSISSYKDLKAIQILIFFRFLYFTLKSVLPYEHFEVATVMHKLTVLLLKDHFSKDDIQDLKKKEEFLFDKFKKLFGVKFMTLNVHYLLHIHEMILMHGPPYLHNCFHFESLNRFITRNGQTAWNGLTTNAKNYNLAQVKSKAEKFSDQFYFESGDYFFNYKEKNFGLILTISSQKVTFILCDMNGRALGEESSLERVSHSWIPCFKKVFEDQSQVLDPIELTIRFFW
jgi:hypothetical protein